MNGLAAANGARRLHGLLSAAVGKPLFWAAFVSLGMVLPIAKSMGVTLPPPLPVLGTVPAFALTDQLGAAFSSKQLEGKVWVADAIATHPQAPGATAQMYEIQHRGRNLGEYFHLVTFTLDPVHDTPAVLHAYAHDHRASPRMWTFATGDPAALHRVLNDGLHLVLTAQGDGRDLVLVDSKMQIRGYYKTDDADAVNRLLRDAGLLANRGY